MQSPESPVASEESKLISGAGFTTLYCTDKIKIELSAQGKYLRSTTFYNRKEKELLYERVSDRAKRKQIETLNINWHLHGNGHTYEYYILQQSNAQDKETVYYKIIRKENTEIIGRDKSKRVRRARSKDDWEYYEKRGQ